MKLIIDEGARNSEMDEYFLSMERDLDDDGLSNINLRNPNRKKPSLRKFREQ